jgi:hypothetical protein
VSYTEVTPKIHAETHVDLHVKCQLFRLIVTKIGMYTQMLLKLRNVKFNKIHSADLDLLSVVKQSESAKLGDEFLSLSLHSMSTTLSP